MFKKAKESAITELKNAIKSNLKRIDDINNKIYDNLENSSCLSKSDLDEIEQSLQGNLKNIFVKGSRFTHTEKLQFTKVRFLVIKNKYSAFK